MLVHVVLGTTKVIVDVARFDALLIIPALGHDVAQNVGLDEHLAQFSKGLDSHSANPLGDLNDPNGRKRTVAKQVHHG